MDIDGIKNELKSVVLLIESNLDQDEAAGLEWLASASAEELAAVKRIASDRHEDRAMEIVSRLANLKLMELFVKSTRDKV